MAMKQKEAIGRILAGDRLLVCEYRSSKIEHISWRDSASGRALEANVLRHVVEAGPDSIVVNERTALDFDPTKFTPPMKKGSRCLVHFTDFRVEKGMISMRGTLEELMPD